MKFFNSSGKQVTLKRPTRYFIDWDGKSRSKFQSEAKRIIYPHWCADVVFEEFPVVGTRMTLDFFNATRRIAIEVDGKQHAAYNKFFHQGSRRKFLEQVQRDLQKEEFCDMNEITLIRVLHDDKIDDILTAEALNNE